MTFATDTGTCDRIHIIVGPFQLTDCANFVGLSAGLPIFESLRAIENQSLEQDEYESFRTQ
jgi:hypothetical protein